MTATAPNMTRPQHDSGLPPGAARRDTGSTPSLAGVLEYFQCQAAAPLVVAPFPLLLHLLLPQHLLRLRLMLLVQSLALLLLLLEVDAATWPTTPLMAAPWHQKAGRQGVPGGAVPCPVANQSCWWESRRGGGGGVLSQSRMLLSDSMVADVPLLVLVPCCCSCLLVEYRCCTGSGSSFACC
jgi:hypothetical protein